MDYFRITQHDSWQCHWLMWLAMLCWIQQRALHFLLDLVFCWQSSNRNNHYTLIFVSDTTQGCSIPRIGTMSHTLGFWQLRVLCDTTKHLGLVIVPTIHSPGSFVSNFKATEMGDDAQLVRKDLNLNVKGLAWLTTRSAVTFWEIFWFYADLLLSFNT